MLAADDADGGVGVGGGDGGTGQTHTFVFGTAHGVAAVLPFACRTDDIKSRVVGLSGGEREGPELTAHQVRRDAEQVVAQPLCRDAGLQVRVAQIQDAEVAFAEEDHRVHLLEEAFHCEAVAWKDDMVALEMGKVEVGQRPEHGQRLGGEPRRDDK